MNLIKRVDDVTSSIGLMQCDPVKIHVKRDAIPYSVSTPRRIPLPMMAKVENELNRMENEGVIIKQTEPTRMVFTDRTSIKTEWTSKVMCRFKKA